MNTGKAWGPKGPPVLCGTTLSPDRGSFKYSQAMKPQATKLSAPIAVIPGIRPQRQFTGDASHVSRCRYGNSIAASDTIRKLRMNPKMPVSVLNGPVGLV